MDQWVYNLNLFADQIGDLGKLFGWNRIARGGSEGLQYSLPAVRGFNACATWVPDEGRGDQDIVVNSADFE